MVPQKNKPIAFTDKKGKRWELTTKVVIGPGLQAFIDGKQRNAPPRKKSPDDR